MKNYKININRAPINDGDIAKGQNFEQVLKSYKAINTPIYKTVKFWFGASAILASAILAVVFLTKSNTTPQQAGFINPPFANADIKRESYTVNSDTATTIIHADGSKIRIPSHAFLDSSGNVVSGPVQIQYREFKKPTDAFLAGIKMTYDSAGEQYHFETAGMMELTATKDGVPLKTNPQALISVDMVSANTDDRFNTYYLDTTAKKWVYTSQSNFTHGISPQALSSDSTSEPLSQKEDERLQHTKLAIAQLEKEKPVQPMKVSRNKPRFSIKVDEKEFPEIAVYSNVKFQVEDKNYNPDKSNLLWEDIDIKRIAGSTNYQIVFTKGTEKYRVIARPVFDEKDYSAASKIYDEKYKKYEAELKKKRDEEARITADLNARAKTIEDKINTDIAERKERTKLYEARLSQSALFYRSFLVADFGIWNCDCPQKLPQEAIASLQLIDASSKKQLHIQCCYLAEKDRNVMFSYTSNALSGFHYNPSKENMLWAVTSDLKLALIRPEQFKMADNKSGILTLELTVIDKKFGSSDEVRDYLKI